MAAYVYPGVPPRAVVWIAVRAPPLETETSAIASSRRTLLTVSVKEVVAVSVATPSETVTLTVCVPIESFDTGVPLMTPLDRSMETPSGRPVAA